MDLKHNIFQSSLKVMLFHVLGAVSVFAQMPEAEVHKRLDFIYNGQAERVRIELPNLEKQYPNDGGVLYLDAILTTDGAAAVKKFQTIVDEYPQNDWADDALYKIYQYYYSVGLYKTADQKLDQLKQQYPTSLYVVGMVKEQVPTQQAPAPEVTKTDNSAQKPEEPPVTVEQTPKEAADTVAALPHEGKFAVQTGAFSSRRKAQSQVRFFSSIGKQAVIAEKIKGEKTFYVVSIEGYANEQDARNAIAELKSKYNIESIIVAR